MGTALAAEQRKQQQQQQQPQKSKEALLRECTTPMTAEDVVPRIALAFQDNDFFRLVQRPAVAGGGW